MGKDERWYGRVADSGERVVLTCRVVHVILLSRQWTVPARAGCPTGTGAQLPLAPGDPKLHVVALGSEAPMPLRQKNARVLRTHLRLEDRCRAIHRQYQGEELRALALAPRAACTHTIIGPITIYEERIIVFYGRAIPAICVTQNATQLESQKGASKHSH